ncbi:MAG: MFS transporter [Nevskiaceae bacterium]|jgi:DHA2 family multidrug resistance protein-like MFS transporter|nr:MFS transporter [Nevskiaceae bacterium]
MTDGLPIPRRYFAIVAIWLAITMTVLDGTITNVALPTIGREIGATAGASIWVINAYQLAITSLLLPLAALGDRIGYHRVYLPGLVVFVLGSVACAFSRNLSLLIAARVLQGIGGAAVVSMNAAMVRAIFPESILGRWIGYNALVLSMAAAAGPSIAGLILSVTTWPWLFLVNVPVGIVSLLISRRALPRSVGYGGKPNYLSAALSAMALSMLIFGAETLARGELRQGWLMLLVAVIAGALLIRRDWTRPRPLLPVDLLRIPIFSLSIATSVTTFAAQMLTLVTLPFLFQTSMGRSVTQTGLLMTLWPLTVGLTAPLAGRLADRYPAGLLGGIGLGVLAAGLLLLSMLTPESSNADIFWRIAVCGAGFGFFQSPNNRTIVTAAPAARSGAAGGMLATARLLGQTTGAVAVAAGFHWMGMSSSPFLLRAAAVAAMIAATISMLRLRVRTEPDTIGV